MSIPYTEHGRRSQKQRTRTALVEATRRLLAAGRMPSVEEAAAEAAISRATAYRYFPNQRALLQATYPELTAESLLPDDPSAELSERVDASVAALTELVLANEPELRAMLRLSLGERPPSSEQLSLRQGRAIGWLLDALAPLRGELAEEEIRRIALAIRLAAGIEALVWLTDVAGLDREQAVSVMRWAARAILAGARAPAESGR